MTDIDVTVNVTDEPAVVHPPVATDTAFLIARVQTAAGAPFAKFTRAQDVRDNYPDDAVIQSYADAYFGEGGATLYLSDLDAGFSAALAALPEELGPGQVIAPTITGSAASATGGDIGGLADWAWETNRVVLLNGARGANVAALAALADDAILSDGGRNAALWGDWQQIPGAAGGPARYVPSSVIVAGMIARNDRLTNPSNPGLAAAGEQGVPVYARGIENEWSKANRTTLNRDQINTMKTVFGQQPRNYGFLTLADLDLLPQWWDLSGSRTIMAIRARERVVAESFMWKTIDGQHILLDRYEGALRNELKQLWDAGALFGDADRPAYSVNVDSTVNPLENLAEGEILAEIHVRTSPPVRNLSINIVHRAITQDV
jgi:phage tail sheath protein FI